MDAEKVKAKVYGRELAREVFGEFCELLEEYPPESKPAAFDELRKLVLEVCPIERTGLQPMTEEEAAKMDNVEVGGPGKYGTTKWKDVDGQWLEFMMQRYELMYRYAMSARVQRRFGFSRAEAIGQEDSDDLENG